MSVFTDTASVAPNSNAHSTMRKYYPEWTDENLMLPEDIVRRESSQGGSNSITGGGKKCHEFLLSSNWVLRPDGLQEFFSEFSKLSLKSEITWDTSLGCFRVRSVSGEEVTLMVAVRDILDHIVQPEIDQVPESERVGTFGGKSSNKIQHVNDWRTAMIGDDELKSYDKFAYPRELMQMGHQDTWHMPAEQSNAGVTIAHILPTKRLLDELQKSSGCTVLMGMDDRSLQIGGSTENVVEVAKQKIDRLLKYHGLSLDSGTPSRHVLYSDSEAAYMTEIRYIAHLNEGLLSTIFLDRTKYSLREGKSTYGRVFSRGSVVSKLLYDYAAKSYRPIPRPSIAPAVEKSKAASTFIPFKGYRYPAKASTWVPDDLSTSASLPSGAVMASFSGVNPQAAPNVVQWAKKTALANVVNKTVLESVNDSSQQLHDPTPPGEAQWDGAREIDPFCTHSSMTASPQTTNASSLQNKVPPLDLLNSSPVRIAKRAVPDRLNPKSSNDSETSLISLSPEKGGSSTLLSWSMAPLLPSTRILDGEQQSREFHSTMEQRAPSKKSQNHQIQKTTDQRLDPSPELIGKISNKLVKILEPLRMFQGRVTLKAELGRFILTNVNPAHISLPDNGIQPSPHRSPDEMEMLLERHSFGKALIATNIVSLSGGDMNYIADLREPGDATSLMWTPSRKSVIYEFRCVTSTVDKKSKHCFIVDVNGEDFSYRVRPDPKESSQDGVFVHCLSRTFDIQFTVDAAPDLTEQCRAFAQELADSLTVKANGFGVPLLSFINHGDWHAIVRSVRIRRAAVYSSTKHQCELEMTQVRDLDLNVESVKGKVNYLVSGEYEGKPNLGVFPVFYEACIKSTVAERAFAENRTLEFAEETKWTGKDLKSAGVFKDLVSSAVGLVKQMDGIGFWCDNKQKAMVHGVPPRSTADAKKQASNRDPPKYSYW